MIHLECTDFKDVFIKLNREYLIHPEKVDFMDRSKGYIRDVFINCNSDNIDLDLSVLGYKKSKWNHLVNNYLIEKDIIAFKEKMDNTSKLTITFHFPISESKDKCLIALVLGRKNQKKPWDSLSIMYRVCECDRKLAVDLALIHKLLVEYWQINPKQISIYMSHCFCEALFINGIFNLFGVPREEITDDTLWGKNIRNIYNTVYSPESKLFLYKTTRTMQLLHRGELSLEPMLIEDLSIKEVIKR